MDKIEISFGPLNVTSVASCQYVDIGGPYENDIIEQNSPWNQNHCADPKKIPPLKKGKRKKDFML